MDNKCVPHVHPCNLYENIAAAAVSKYHKVPVPIPSSLDHIVLHGPENEGSLESPTRATDES